MVQNRIGENLWWLEMIAVKWWGEEWHRSMSTIVPVTASPSSRPLLRQYYNLAANKLMLLLLWSTMIAVSVSLIVKPPLFMKIFVLVSKKIEIFYHFLGGGSDPKVIKITFFFLSLPLSIWEFNNRLIYTNSIKTIWT